LHLPWDREEGGDDEDVIRDMDLVAGDNDYLVVKFACNSFFLISPGTGAKIVILDPFLGSLSMYNNVRDCCVTVGVEEIASTREK
jgi:hypothetical protein